MDDKGNCIEKEVNIPDEGTYRKQICKYDKENNLIEETAYDSFRDQIWRFVYEYNDKKEKIKLITYGKEQRN